MLMLELADLGWWLLLIFVGLPVLAATVAGLLWLLRLPPFGERPAALTRGGARQRAKDEGVHRHAFTLALPDAEDPLHAIERVKQLAMCSHWAALKHAPEIDASPAGGLEIQVFALDREHALALEAAVRRGMSQPPRRA
ncbi:hypothetical protein G6O69_03545 [Pseudenhygromyxa sp. WMMC2535]|uniref:hypothetical protein n=1 Tax=Pseudenhygromyxa sp. WMMC2535 TaxID=2712867 RepID=UPI001556FF28|nr:hypothetical protein [Pseudenhygromyxa sp. WMMC2535]NVB36889.1 hypothetical protein [Pseudenhygromyxa sp. WMMC2535]